jgi:PKD repeat protein
MFIKVPENDGRQVEFTLQDNGSASFDPALDRSAFLPASFPDTIHLRIRSDGTSLTAAYSEDGTEWTDVGRVRPAGAIPDPRIGVAAFNGDGTGNEAEFDYFHADPLDVEPTCTEPEAPDPGYEMLFDGTAESASQWQMAGPGGFNLTAQCTLESFGGLGMLYRDELYEDPVTFRLDWMIPGDDNSGVVVGNWEPDPDYPSGPAWDALDNGYEIQIDATDDLDSTTGALYNIQAADQELRDEALNPPGEWNTFEITVDDPEIIVRLNGVVINEYVHDPGTYPNRDISATKLGIQNHGPGDTIFYRRIQVRLGQVNNPPVIESIAADPSSGDAPLEVALSVTASDPDGDELSYEWDFGDGETSTEEDPTHTYSDPGTYEAEVTVSDGEAEVSDSATVTVEDGPVGEPDLSMQAPKVVKVKPRQNLAKFRFRATNSGDAASGPVRLCVKAPNGKLALKGKKCTTTDIPAGEVRQRQVRLRVKPKARGKTTKVKLTAAGPNVDNQTKVVRVRAGR